MRPQLISYGAVTKDFRDIAKLMKYMDKIENGEIPSKRLDCYPINILVDFSFISNFLMLGEFAGIWRNAEIFKPSIKYPPHKDGNGISYFIGLENGQFYIDGVTYEIVPFVLYSFDDWSLHNTNFPAIMLS